MSLIFDFLAAVPDQMGAAIYGVGILILAIVFVCAKWFLSYAVPSWQELQDILDRWRRDKDVGGVDDVEELMKRCRVPRAKLSDVDLRSLLMQWRAGLTEVDARMAQASATASGLVRGAIVIAAGLVALGVVLR